MKLYQIHFHVPFKLSAQKNLTLNYFCKKKLSPPLFFFCSSSHRFCRCEAKNSFDCFHVCNGPCQIFVAFSSIAWKRFVITLLRLSTLFKKGVTTFVFVSSTLFLVCKTYPIRTEKRLKFHWLLFHDLSNKLSSGSICCLLSASLVDVALNTSSIFLNRNNSTVRKQTL